MGPPMRIELTRVGLLVYLANHYTTRGAQVPILSGVVKLLNHEKKNKTKKQKKKQEQNRM